MASYPDSTRAAKPSVGTEGVRVHGKLVLLLAALSIAAIGATVAILELATLQRNAVAPTHAPAFLTRALGAAEPSHALVRTPAPDVRVAVHGDGFTFSTPDGSVGVRSDSSGSAWTDHRHGAVRSTATGPETITVTHASTEQYRTVTYHHGIAVWKWQLDTTLEPRLSSTGTIGFFDGRRLTDLELKPVSILDGRGRDITPPGLHWDVHGRSLALTLDDRKLPVPYTIDPAALRATSTVGTIAAPGAFTVPIPAAATNDDLLLLHFVATGGKNLSGTTLSLPTDSNSTNNAWTPTGTPVNTSTGAGGNAVHTLNGAWYKYVKASDGGNVTVTAPSSTGAAVAEIDVYKGVDSTASQFTAQASASSTSTSVACPAFSSNATTQLYLCLVGASVNGASGTAFSGAGFSSWTYDSDTDVSTGSATGAAYHDDSVTSTTIAGETATGVLSGTGPSTGIGFGFKDDVTAPSTPSSFTASGLTEAVQGTGAFANTVYVKSGGTGGFTLTGNGAADAESGVAYYTYPSLAGYGGPGTYTFTGSTPAASGSLTATNNAALPSGALSVSVIADGAGPGGGAFKANGLDAAAGGSTSYLTSGTTLTINSRTDFTEAQDATHSGLASSTLTIQTGTLSNNACSSYGAPATIPSGTNTQTVASGKCYLLTLTGVDNVGNSASVSTTVKVDTALPGAPALAVSGATGSGYYPGSGSVVFFEPGTAAGFTVAGSGSTDGGSGIASYTYPALGAGYSNTAGAYTLTAAAATASGNVAATNNAGVTGSTTSFTAQADGNVPQNGALTANSGATYLTSGTTLTINSRTDYTEAQDATHSGLASSTLTIDNAPLTNNVCGSYSGSPSTITGTTSQTVASGRCYLLTLKGTDRVGNTASVSQTVKVDTTSPGTPTLAFSGATGSGYYPGSGSIVFFKPGTAAGFTVSPSSTDGGSGIASYTYPTLGSGYSNTAGAYTLTGSAATATGSVTATNNASVTGAGTSFTAQADNNAPQNGSFTANSGLAYITSGTTLTVNSRTDYSEAQDATHSGVASSILTIQQGTLSNNACSSYGSPSTITGTTSQTVSTGHCYLLTLTGTDHVGNTASATQTVKVDTNAPGAPALAFSSPTGSAYYPGSGSIVFFKPGSAGGFTVTGSGSTEGGSGIASYTYPALGAGYSNTAGAYALSGSAATATGSVAATNNASVTGSGTSFTAQGDSTAPINGALTVNGGSAYVTAGTTLTIDARTDYQEPPSPSDSGLASSILTIEQGTLSNNACSSYGAPSTITGTTAQTVSSGHCYRLTLTGTDHVGNTASVTQTVKVDTAAPGAPALAFSSPTGSAYYPGSGSIVYFESGTAAGFTVTGSGSTDGGSGIASYAYPALGAGYSNTGGAYTLTSAAVTRAGSVTATNGAGSTSAGTSFTAQADSTAPTGGVLTVNGGSSYITSGTTLTIGTRTDYTEPPGGMESGLASSTLTIEQGTLSNDACFSYGAPSTITGTTAQTISTGHCYRLTLTGTDHVGNTASLTRTVKVDTTAPAAPALAFTGATGSAYYTGSGSTVYFKPGAAAGFTVTPSSTDGGSGIASYSYPGLGTGYSNVAGSYSLTSAAGSQSGSITATNGAGVTGAGATFTAQGDSIAPVNGAFTANGGATWITSGTTLAIDSRTDYQEAPSAVDSGLASSILTIEQGTLSNNACSSYGSPSTITGTTAQTVSSGHCYRLTLTGTDHVGNTASVTQTVKVDTAAPGAPTLAFSGATGSAYYPGTGSTVYFKGGTTAGFTVTGSGSTDGGSGISSYSYPALGAGYSNTGGAYTLTSTAGSQTGPVTATNNAGVTGIGTSFTAEADSSAPANGAFTANGGATWITSGTTLTLDSRTDFSEPQDATDSGLASSTLTVQQGILSNNACSSYGAPSTITGTTSQTVSSGHCYLLTLTGTDNVGNTASISRTVKVDTDAPGAPALAFSSPTGSAYYPGSGSTVYFKGGTTAGFTVTGSGSTDGGSGIASYSYPALGAGYANTGGAYTLTSTADTQTGPVTATNNAGVTGTGTSFTAQADTTAPSGGALTVNGGATYITTGTTLTIDTRTDYTESRDAADSGLASSTLTIEQGTLSSNGCSSYGAPSTITGTTSQTVSSGHCYRLTLTGTDHVGNTASVSQTVKVDTAAPGAPTLAFSGATGSAYYPGTGSTVYFKGGTTAGFAVTGSGSTDGGSGIASYSYPALGTGYANTAGAYSLTGAAGSQTGSVTATNNANVTGAATSFTAGADTTAPSGGALTVNGGNPYITSGTALTIDTRTDYAEPQDATDSGLAASTLTIQTGTLSNGTCSSYGAPSTITGTTAQTVSTGHCYRLTLTGTDHVGNTASLTQTVEVDTSAPSAPALAFSGATGSAYYPGSGSVVYFKGGTTAGFTVTPTSSDGGSGIASYSYPSLGTGYSNVAGTYSITSAADTQAGSAAATNNAGVTGGGTSFTAEADTTAPGGGALTVNGGATYLTSGTTLTIDTRTDYTEPEDAADSGLASSTLTVQTGALSGNTCTGYGAPSTITGSPDQTISSGHCYLLTLTGTDNVGNTTSISRTVKVDTDAPGAPSLGFSSFTGSAYYPGSGSTVYFKGGTTAGFTVTGSGSTDGGSGIASYSYPALGAGYSNTGGAYTLTSTADTQTGPVTATNNAGVTGTGTSFTAEADTTAPSGGALTVNDGATYITSGTALTIDNRTDYAEPQDAADSGLSSSTLTISEGDLSGDSCANYRAPAAIAGTTDQTVASGHCYLLTLTGTDDVGNTASVSQTVKVDTSAPTAPSSITATLLTNAIQGDGANADRIYFRSGATGGFTVTATGAQDDETSLQGYTYPALAGFAGNGSYSFDASSTTQTGAVTATNGGGTTGAGLSFTAQADANPPTGGAFTANGGNAYITSGTTLTIDSRTEYTETQSATESGLATSVLTIEDGTLSGNLCSGYGAPTTISGTASQTVADGHCYRLTLAGTDAVGNSTSVSHVVKVDLAGPAAPTLSFSNLTNAYASGNTVYFKSGATGGFRVAAGSTDGGSGVASYSFPTLAGLANTAGDYTFDDSSTTQSGDVTAVDNAGTPGTGTTLTAEADATAPTGGALVVNGGNLYLNSGTTLTIDTRDDFTEPQTAAASGLASSRLTIQSAPLTGNSCGVYDAPTTIADTTDQAVASGNCYLLTLKGTDNVGNTASVVRTVRVDTTAPSSPGAVAVATGTHAYYPGSGDTVYFKSGAFGSFTITASGATDDDTDIESYRYDALPGFSGGNGTYVFDGASTTQTGGVTASNNAGLTGSELSFTAQADGTAPTGGAVAIDGGAAYRTSGTSVSISTTSFDETPSPTESGIAANTLTVETAALSGDGCGSYGAAVDITGQTSQTVASGNCYRFTLTGTDRVGNSASTSAVVMVDTSAPTAPTAISVTNTTNAYFPGSGTTVFFKGGSTGSFTVTASGATDDETGVSSYVYGTLTGFTGTADYVFDGSSTTQTGSIAAANGAAVGGPGLSFTAEADSTAPTGGSLTVNGGGAYLTSGTSVSIATNDFGDGESGIASNALTVETGALSGDACTGYGGPTDITGESSYAVATGNCYRFTLTGTDNVGNTDSVSRTVEVDTTAPSAPSLSFSGLSHAFAAGTTVYFRDGATGGFTVTPSSIDDDTDIASYSYPSLTGFAGANGDYTFDASSTTQTGGVTATNDAGLTSGATPFTARVDATSPIGGALTVNGGDTYLTTGTSVSIAATPYSEPQSATESGLASSKLTVESASLSGNSCSAYGNDSDITGQSTHAVAGGNCYRFTLTGTDNVGNAASVVRTVLVDSSAPSAPTALTFGGLTNAFYPGAGSTVFFKSGSAGGFTVTASGAADAESGITGYSYSSLPGFDGNGAYTFDASSTTQTGSATATNGASVASAGTSFTAQADGAAPSSTITCNGAPCPSGWTSSAPIDVAIDATDGGSRVASITYTTDGSDPALGGITVAASSAAFQLSSAATVRWIETDNVGNVSAPRSVTLQIDTTAPSAPTTISVTGTTHASFDGDSTIFFQGGGSGSFTLTASGADDAESGLQTYDYPSLPGFANAAGAYTFDASSSTRTGSVTATNNAATTGPGKSFTAEADASGPATTVECDGSACSSGWSTGSPVRVSLAADDGSGSGVASISYTTDGSDPTSSGTATTDPGGSAAVDVTAAGTTTVKWVATDKVGNVSSVASQDIRLDTTAPGAPTLSFTGAFAGGDTVYFKGGTTGSFTVAPSSIDAESGVALYAYPTLAGFTNTNGDYAYDASSATQSGAITATNAAGLTGAGTTFTARADSTGPTGGAVVVDGGNAYLSSGTSVSLDVTNFAEAVSPAESGIASNALTVETGTLANDACTSYGAPQDITGQTSYAVATAHCYRFTLTGTDHVGNASFATSTVKVDTTAPTTAALALTSASGGAYYPGTGSTVYFDPSTAGSFDVTASASDDETGVGFTFPSVGGNWSTSGSGTTRTYSYVAPAGAGGSQTVTAANGAGGSATAGFTLTPDTDAPITTAQCNGAPCGSGWFTSAPVQLELSAADAGSGVQQTRYTVDGSSPTPISGAAYTGPIDVSATTTYTFRSWDDVGNAEPPVTLTIRVDDTAPTFPALSLSESSPFESVSGSTLYYNPSGSNDGSFTVTASPGDAESAIAKVEFPALAGMPGGGDATGPYSATYGWDSTATSAPGPATATAYDNAGLTADQTFAVSKDVTGPTGASISYTSGYDTSGSVAFTTADGVDTGGAGVAAGTGAVERRTTSLAGGVCDIANWGAWTTVAGSPDAVATGDCVQYRFRISDEVGNETVATGGTVKVDTSAPQTTLDAQPADPSGNATPTFRFSSDESATFECNLDGNGWTSCSSPDTLPTLADGGHTLLVRATDLAGNVDATPAADAWYVDLTAPTVSLTSPADAANVSGSVAVSTTAADNHTVSPAVVLQTKPHSGSTWTTISSPWDTTSLGDGQHDLRAIATDDAGNSTTSAVITVDVDNHAPAISFDSSPTYVNAASPATVPLTVSSTDTDIASVQFYECSNGSTTCAGGTWIPIGAAVTSAPWTTGWTPPAADGTKAVKAIATDGAANTGSDMKTVAIDRTAPTGVSISYPGGYTPDGTVSIATGNGPDADVDATSGLIESRTASLAGDSCSSWSGWTALAGPTDTVADAHCAQYRYTVSDDAGNALTVAGSGTVKVDQTAPTGAGLEFSGLDHAYTSGSTVFVKTGGTGGFTVATTSADPESGIASTAYPALGSGWTDTAGAYTFDGSAAAPSGVQQISVRNGAGLAADGPFTVVGDDDAPVGGSISYADGFTSGTSTDVTLAAGNDAGGSGIDTKVLERADTTLTSGSCDLPFGAFTPLATDPASPYTDATLQSGHCYVYRYVVTDRLGNAATYTSGSRVEVDTDAPGATMTDPGTNRRGTVALSATTSDTGGSAVDHVDFQIKLHTGSTWTTVGSDSSAPYSVGLDTTSPQLDGDYDFRAVAYDGAGNWAGSAPVGPDTIDNTAPDTTVASKPSNPSNNATPTFGYTSTETGSTFECRVDGGAFAICANPVTLPGLGEGTHTFEVRASDLAGNTDPTAASYTWTVDTVPPVADLSDPGAHLSGTATLSSTSTDISGTGVQSVTFETSPAGQNVWTPLAGSSWDTAGGSFADGLYDLHVIARDGAGNIATSSAIANVRVDNTAPTVTITNPVSGGGVSGTVGLAATTPDADPSPSVVWSYKLHADSTWTPVGGSSWDTHTLDDGHYDVRAVVTDWAGNQTTQTSTDVVVDNQAPDVDATSPADGGYINAADSDPYTLSAGASDNGTGVKHVDFYECSSASCATRSSIGSDTSGSNGVYSTAWNLPGDGLTWIEAVASDNVGHTSSSVVSVTIDRTLPDTTIETKPGDPTNDAHPAFTFDASEQAARFECRFDGGSWTTCASPYSLASVPADGSHTVEIRSVDLAGNTDATPGSWTWLEDRTAPTATMTDPAAANAAHAVRATVALTAATADPGANASGLDTTTYEYSADGATWVPIASPAAWDTTAIADGVYQLHVVVTDHAGNSTTSGAVTNVKIDNTVPVSAQDDPGQYLHNTVTLTGTAADPADPQGNPGSGIDHVDFQVSPTGANSWSTIGTATTAPYSYDYDTHALADGYYDFRMVATDVAGNLETVFQPVVNRLVDNTKPTVTIGDPGANLHGSITLTDTAADASPSSGIVSTEFEVSPAGSNTWTPVGASWNTTGVTDGLYDIRVTVMDGAGNASDPSVVASRRVDNTKPHTSASGVPSGFSATDVTVALSPDDAGGSGIADTIYQLDGGPVQHGTTVVVSANDNDGTHTITYQSVDVAGNVEDQQSVSVEIDATPPACPTCSSSDYLHGTVHLTATPDDSGAGIESVAFQYSANGTVWTTIGTDATGTSGTYATDWDTSGLDGAYHLRARIEDKAGNLSDVDLHSGGAGLVAVDNAAPSVAVGAPTAGTEVGGSVHIAATASDANALSFDFLVNGSQIASGSSASTNWDTTSLGDGSATIEVRATDPAGNTTTSAPVTVTVDNHAPTPTLDDPGAAVSGTKTLGVSTDGDTVTVEFQERLQGAPTWTTIGTTAAPFAQAWNTTSGVPDGTYELRAIATDGAGHTGTSAPRTVLVDNTLPTASFSTPTAGSTIGGHHAPLAVTAADGGSGIASVSFAYKPAAGSTWTTIDTVTAGPYQTTWDAQSVATGVYQLEAVVTDAAGNSRTTTPLTVDVDSSAPAVTFASPGPTLEGAVPLSATTSGPDAVSVTFQYSVAGANAWQTIRTDNAAPWSASFDTSQLPDGSYDVRATAADDLGNVGSSTVVTALLDNHLPAVASATPTDGATVASADSIALELSEPSTLTAVTLDGNPTVAPNISGTHVSFPTGTLAPGAHTLALTLTDAAGNHTRAAVHFTVFQPSQETTAPPVEANASPSAAMTVDSADGSWSVTVPAGAMPAGSDPSNWVVVRLAPTSPAGVPAAPAGVTMERVVEIVARWLNGSGELHQFAIPLDIAFRNAAGLVPATAETGGTWRMISHVDGALPADQPDGWYRDGTTLHVLTRHLTLFGLAAATAPPGAPQSFNATVNDGNLYLRWDPASTEASGSPIAGYTVFVDGVSTKDLGAAEYQYAVGPYDPADPHSYSVVATDAAGHTGAPTPALAVLPRLVGLQLEDAKAALTAKGFVAGDATVTDSDEPAGTVVGPAGAVAAAPGAIVPLQVSAGPDTAATKFVFSVAASKRLALDQRRFIGVHLAATRGSMVTATLVSAAGKALFTWHIEGRAGVSIVKLALPRRLQKPGTFRLRWRAASGGDVVQRTIVVQIARTKKGFARATAATGVLVAGSALPERLPPAVGRTGKVVLATSEESTFELSADPHNNVEVIVIDADEYTLGTIHDLHTVFPLLKLIALSNSRQRQTAAVRAGATVGLPKTTPVTKLVKVVTTLAAVGSVPAQRR